LTHDWHPVRHFKVHGLGHPFFRSHLAIRDSLNQELSQDILLILNSDYFNDMI